MDANATNLESAVFADDTGEHFASIDSEGSLNLSRPGQAPQHLVTIRGSQPDWVRRVFFSPDSRRLVTVGTQKTAKVWDVETGELLLRLAGHRRQIGYGVAYSPG